MNVDFTKKIFKNVLTNEETRVISQFEDICILEDKTKVRASDLLDVNKYIELPKINENVGFRGLEDEVIDPDKFLNLSSNYISQTIKSIPDDIVKRAVDDENVNIITQRDESSIYSQINETDTTISVISEEEAKKELMNKYNVSNLAESTGRQKDIFDSLINGDEDITKPVVQDKNTRIVESPKVVEIKVDEKREDPIVTMFKNIKRVNDFEITISIKNKLPRYEFIEMMEDSYNVSIIDYLSSEFTNELLRNPSIIENTIKEEIKKLVYKPNLKNKDIDITTSPKTKTRKPRTKKQNINKKDK
jgi:hypothetical protein